MAERYGFRPHWLLVSGYYTTRSVGYSPLLGADKYYVFSFFLHENYELRIIKFIHNIKTFYFLSRCNIFCRSCCSC